MKNHRTNPEKSGATVELPELAQTIEVGGITVSVRCMRVHAPQMRYELVMVSQGEQCVIDVAGGGSDESLRARIEEAAICFATALSLRGGAFS